jgi:hypothetical protein
MTQTKTEEEFIIKNLAEARDNWYKKGYQTAKREIIEDVLKEINEQKCYCEQCAFEGKHDSKEDKLIYAKDLIKKLEEMKK